MTLFGDDPFAGPATGGGVETADITDGLNPAQRDAVLHRGGPLLVVAGAGSGKTRVLTNRIAHLIRADGLSPFELLAITFTNKAAGEMRDRVGGLVGPVAEKMWVSTFHSACVRILRRDAQRLGYPSAFSIYDQADAVRLTGYVLRDLNLDSKRFPPRSIHAQISAQKNDLVSPEQYADRASNIFERKIADAYVEYQRRLQAAGAMDFDDLLTVTVELFRTEPEVLDTYRQRFRHVLVDEYQDTNRAQNEIVLQLGAQHRNVCVVGDGDQCLPPDSLVTTPSGRTPIGDVAVGDEVVGVGGDGKAVVSTVTHVERGRWRGRLYRVRAGGAVLRGTPHHVVPAVQSLPEGRHVVYLMHREDRGYRIGRTKAVTVDSRGRRAPGLRDRIGQEHADAAWILRTCDTESDAAYWEAWFAAEYGLPTACFHASGRRLSIDDGALDRLFGSIDTETRAKLLFDELDLHPEFPHAVRPDAGAVELTMFGSSDAHVVTPQAGRGDETLRADYREAVALARRVADAGGFQVRRRMRIGDVRADLLPLAHLRPGMRVLVDAADGTRWETVEEVGVDHYDGPVVDLEVDPAHNYVADGVVVHNSIYAFRGADIRNILEFEEAYPDATTIVLDQNYRSTQTILDAANAVIANNEGRKPKDLWTEAGPGEPIVVYAADDESDEANWVAGEIARLHDGGDVRWADIAVFFRTNAQSRVLEERLVGLGVPYKVIGGTRFYDRREVKDALAYLRAVVNPTDEVSVKRVLNTPKRGVGDGSVAKLDAYANAHSMTFVDALRRPEEAGVSGRALKGIMQFLALRDGLAAEIEHGPSALLRQALERSGYLDELRAERSIEAEGRMENLAELIGTAESFESAEEFLEQVSLVADVDALDDDDSQVVLMTLHSAKGLEFPIVFILGLEDGVFPHVRALTEPHELEEERRLCYVGITRARERLHLSYAWSRSLFGSTQYNPPSRFLGELPESLVDQRGASRSSGRASMRGGGDDSWSSRRRPVGPDAGIPERALSVLGDPGDRAERRAARREKARERMIEKAIAAGAENTTTSGTGGLRPGDDVAHGTFGDGVILDIIGEGDNAEVVVNFLDVGEKRLLLSWAKLERR